MVYKLNKFKIVDPSFDLTQEAYENFEVEG